MIVYSNYLSFKILGKNINIFSEDTDYGRNTIAEVDDIYHYLGDVEPTVETAIALWQKLNGKELSEDEMIDSIIEGYSEIVTTNVLGNNMATKKKTKSSADKKALPAKKTGTKPVTKKKATSKKPAEKKEVTKKSSTKKSTAKPTTKKKPVTKSTVKKEPKKKDKVETKAVKAVVDSTGVVTMTPFDSN